MTKPNTSPEAQAKKKRLAAALKANLKKRKEQGKLRSAVTAKVEKPDL